MDEFKQPQLGAIILAAGLGRRLGGDKLLSALPDGRPLYRSVLELAAELNFRQTVVVTNASEIAAEARQLGYLVVANPAAESGKASSIRAGLEALSEALTGVIFFVADQPLLQTATVRALIRCFQVRPETIVYPLYGTENQPTSEAEHTVRRGNPVIFPSALRGELLALQGDEGGMKLSDKHPSYGLAVGSQVEAFDVDTPEDLQILRHDTPREL